MAPGFPSLLAIMVLVTLVEVRGVKVVAGTLPEGEAERGRVLYAAAAGCGCHTPESGPVGAGGREITTPFGTFYSTNITPDADTGIGSWSSEEIGAAIRDGVLPNGGIEAPVMPYYRYSGMSDKDSADLIAYLRTLPAVRRPNRDHDIGIPLPRWGFWGWKLLYGRGATPTVESPRDPTERGRYLVDHVAICGDCHTPRNAFGASKVGMYLAGTTAGPDGASVPNLTPDATGKADWTAEDFVTLLVDGMKPNFDNVQGMMAEVIDGHGGGPGYSAMDSADREAIGAYLKGIPPVTNDLGAD